MVQSKIESINKVGNLTFIKSYWKVVAWDWQTETETEQLRIEGHFGFRTFWTNLCNILKYGMKLKFKTIVQIFRKTIQLAAVVILKSTNEYHPKKILKTWSQNGPLSCYDSYQNCMSIPSWPSYVFPFFPSKLYSVCCGSVPICCFYLLFCSFIFLVIDEINLVKLLINRSLPGEMKPSLNDRLFTCQIRDIWPPSVRDRSLMRFNNLCTVPVNIN